MSGCGEEGNTDEMRLWKKSVGGNAVGEKGRKKRAEVEGLCQHARPFLGNFRS